MIVNNVPEKSIEITDGETVIATIVKDTIALMDVTDSWIDDTKITELIESMDEEISIPPTNALINDEGEIIEGKAGVQINRKKARALLYDAFYTGNVENIEVPKEIVYPQVNAELLADIYVEDINHFRTFYNPENKERSRNIGLSVAAINNHVLFPGEMFSFNKIVGERTVERGYKKAPVIVKGELSEDIGGGICQVSSTLFNAVTLKGIQIMERYSHSRSVPYVPPGKDAAVSWWGPDFVFKNTYQKPILIRAKADKGEVVITIYAGESDA